MAKKAVKSTTVKVKGIFDFLSCLKEKKVPWDDLTDMDKKAFTPYIINRFLSMNMYLLPIVNDLQPYTIGLLKPREVYKLYYEFLPKQKSFDKYIKGVNDQKYNKELLNYLTKWFQVSKREVMEYLEILPNDEVIEILQAYGLSNKEAIKLTKTPK